MRIYFGHDYSRPPKRKVKCIRRDNYKPDNCLEIQFDNEGNVDNAVLHINPPKAPNDDNSKMTDEEWAEWNKKYNVPDSYSSKKRIRKKRKKFKTRVIRRRK